MSDELALCAACWPGWKQVILTGMLFGAGTAVGVGIVILFVGFVAGFARGWKQGKDPE